MVKRSREDFDILSATENEGSPESASELDSANFSSDSVVNASENSKLLNLDIDGGVDFESTEVMRCSLPPHGRQVLSFTSFEDYEVHYNKVHVNRCSECRKNFPTPHFLDLHIAENHNPLAEVLKDRGERTYACFVEDCDRKCSTSQKRRMHLIDKHMFPKDYDFHIVNDGIDQRSSMLRSGRHRRRSSAVQHKSEIEDRTRRRTSLQGKSSGGNATAEATGRAIDPEGPLPTDSDAREAEIINRPRPDTEMSDLVGAMSALNFVPASVRFGRGKGRGGFSKS